MDENAVRSLLEHAAAASAPPSTVDVARARRIGKRNLRLLRFGTPASVSAVAVVVGLAVTGVIPVGAGSHPGGSRSAPGASEQAKHAFNPLVPYATFGWLPPGYSVSAWPAGPGSMIAATVETFEASDHSGRSITLGVYPVRQCHLTGIRPGPGPRRGTLACGGRLAPDQYGPGPVTGPIPGVLGGHAYRLGYVKYGGLVLRAAKAWVIIEPATKITLATQIRIAAHVRFGSGQPLVFPFRLAGLPSRWRVGSSDFWILGGRMAGLALTLGPAPRSEQIGVSTAFATPGSCQRDSGSQRVTVDGHRGFLRTIRYDHYQALCFSDVGGLTVSLTVDRPFTGSPLAAAEQPGGVIDIFLHHLRLLGTDPVHWTTHPVSG